MKKLELMGVQEMDAMEMRNENGGLAPLVILGAIYLVPAAIYVGHEIYKVMQAK